MRLFLYPPAIGKEPLYNLSTAQFCVVSWLYEAVPIWPGLRHPHPADGDGVNSAQNKWECLTHMPYSSKWHPQCLHPWQPPDFTVPKLLSSVLLWERLERKEELGGDTALRYIYALVELSLLERLMHHNPLYKKKDGSYNPQFVTKLLRNYRYISCSTSQFQQVEHNNSVLCLAASLIECGFQSAHNP